MNSTGTVYLIGAGPGDAELITVKGLRLLRAADVILYDRLVNADLLAEARPTAELIDVGKLPTKHRLSQDAINDLIVDRAREGLTVVRLKGGDPFVFGRGGEEALACHAAGIPFEIVPGISSAIAVPAYAGIPVTQRGIAGAFTVFAGYEDPTKEAGSVDYEGLAHMANMGTLILLMGVARLPAIVARLVEAGVAPETPAACIEWGTTARQRVIDAQLVDLPARIAEAGIDSPATTVIGGVVALRSGGLDWFAPEKNLKPPPC